MGRESRIGDSLERSRWVASKDARRVGVFAEEPQHQLRTKIEMRARFPGCAATADGKFIAKQSADASAAAARVTLTTRRSCSH